MLDEQLERAQAEHQAAAASLKSSQAEINIESNWAYSKSWYLPLLFYIIFNAVYLIGGIGRQPFDSGNTLSYIQPSLILGFVIMIAHYFLFGLAKLVGWLRRRLMQLSISVVVYAYGAVEVGREINGQALSAKIVPFFSNFWNLHLLYACAATALIAVVWLVSIMISRNINKQSY